MSKVFATWHLASLPADLEDLHISCGVGDDQGDPFDLFDTGAKLTVTHDGQRWTLTYSAPSAGLECRKGYWLSPCTLGPDEIEADLFGIKKGK